ncbi:MAG TPA: TerC family protein [Burkholderiales bacterium]|jgi:YjbE family integral membrane protein|nr:TerC family protein [Burkholderiales bacterium]
MDGDFWVDLAQIVGVNIVLSGDNAVVIAMAARSLPARHQKAAIVAGSGAAIVLRVVLTAIAARVLALPFLRLVGSLLLLWIGVQLMVPGEAEGAGDDQAASGLAGAIRTILIADLVMSLDNVIAVAAAAHGNFTLLVIGLGISIPLIIFGSTALMKLMGRFPIIVTLGAGLLGYVAGEMLTSEQVTEAWTGTHLAHAVLPWVGAALVIAVGLWLSARARRHPAPDGDPGS